jgi:hypothetical protein
MTDIELSDAKKKIEITKVQLEDLRNTLQEESDLLDNMLTTMRQIKQGLIKPVNPILKAITASLWVVLIMFIVGMFTYAIGQAEYGIWLQYSLSPMQRGVLTIAGVTLVAITGVFTIITYYGRIKNG